MSPREIGYVLGKALGTLLVLSPFLAGGGWSFYCLFRSNVNKLCALSSLFLCGGFSIGLVISALVTKDGQSDPNLEAAVGTPIVLGMLVSLPLAIAGLIQRRRHEPRPKGLTMAVVSLFFSLPAFVLIVAGIIIAATQGGGAATGSAPDTGALDADDELRFEEFNFAYARPSSRWVDIDMSASNPDVTMALVRTRPQVFLTVIAEVSEESFDTGMLTSIAKANLRAGGSDARIGPVEPLQAGGLEWNTFASDCRVDGQHIAYRNACATRNGYAYQLIVFAEHGDKRQLDAEFHGLLNAFRQIDPDRAYSSPAGISSDKPAREQRSKTYQYEVAPGEGWSDVLEEMRTAEYGVQGVTYAAEIDDNVYFAVAPLVLGGVPASHEALQHAMVGVLGFAMDEVTQVGEHQLSKGTTRTDYTATRAYDSYTTDYSFRVLTAPDGAYFVGVWSSRPELRPVDRYLDALDRFRLLTGKPSQEAIADSHERHWVARLLNEVALYEYEHNQNRPAVEHFDMAVRLDASESQFLENLSVVGAETYGPKAMLKRLDAHISPFGKSQQIHLIQGRLHAQAQEYDKAIDSFAAAAQEAPLEEDDLYELANAAVSAERYDEAIAALAQASEARPHPKLLRWHATMLSRAGRHAEAISKLVAMEREAPDDDSIAYALAEAYEGDGRYSEGIAVCDRFLDKNDTSLDIWTIRGRLQIYADDYLAAKQSLERALAIAPGDTEATELLTHVSGMLGRGDNRLIREPIEPVDTPPALAARLRQAEPSSSPDHEAGLIERFKSVGYEFRSGQPLRVTTHRQIAVTDRRGVESVTTLSIPFDPLSEHVYVNDLIVRDGQGKELARGQLEDYYVLDDNSSGLDTYDQILKAPVPAVRPGAVIELRYTVESLSSLDDFDFETHYLCSATPIGISALFVRGDIDLIAADTLRVSESRPDDTTIVWVAERPDPVVQEPYQQDVESYLPRVILGDNRKGWAALAKEYLEDLEQVLEVDDSIERLAAQICSDSTGRPQQIEALASYVQETLAYNGIEFGVRGVVPNTVSRIRHNKSGDCKDHALLLHHLLRSIGVESHLALANTSGPVLESIPSTDQFDHMVLYVPDMPLRNGLTATDAILDATQKSVDPMLGISSSLANKRVLVLAPDHPRLINTPGVSTDHTRIACRREIQIVRRGEGGDTETEIDETVKFNPISAAPYREVLRNENRDNQRKFIQQLIGEGSVIDELSFTGLDNLKEPLQIRCRYRIPDAFQEVEGTKDKIAGSVPTHWLSLYCVPDPVENRQSPFEFKTPFSYQLSSSVTPPAGYRAASLGKRDHLRQGDALNWRSDARVTSEGDVELRCLVKRPARGFSPSEYAPYEKSVRHGVRSLAKIITFEPVPNSKPTPSSSSLLPF